MNSPIPSTCSCLVLLAAVAGPLWGQTTSLVSVDSIGSPGDLDSYSPSISADDRYIAFYSEASNLVPGDANDEGDIFLRDLQDETTTLVSVGPAGVQGDGESEYPSLSADGRFVVFYSFASNFAPGDTNGVADVFVRDLHGGTTKRVSIGSSGQQGNDASTLADISGDGRFVVFESQASNLVLGDTNGRTDVFVRDRLLRRTTRVDVDSSGAQAERGARDPGISDDGRYVLFESSSTDLVPGDTNGSTDLFVHDLVSGTTTLASVASSGAQANEASTFGSISADGRYVIFGSFATNLVPGDTNRNADVFVRDLLLGTTERVSVSSAGTQASGYSPRGTISADGRYVAFKSAADDLVVGDGDATMDIFARDLVTGTTERVSVALAGLEPDGFSSQPTISADGRQIAFYSEASNLVAGDTNGSWDVFVRSFGKIRRR
jgi:Tol biopolymer transport system component